MNPVIYLLDPVTFLSVSIVIWRSLLRRNWLVWAVIWIVVV